MKQFMFGLDASDPSGSARKLAARGYDAVVLSVGDAHAVQAAKAAGLAPWLCFGAHTMGDFAQADVGAKNARGADAPWFGSACPNARAVGERNMDAAFAFAEKCDCLTGIYVDGARFASFASEEGASSFFGCFCDRCMEKMTALGIDAQATRDGVAALMDFLDGGDGDIPMIRAAMENWFDFRAACVRSYMDSFSARAHAAGLKAGAFVFAPTLWYYVGQRPDALTSLDVVSPMLYRAYPHEAGTACLSHEWAAFHELLSHAQRPADEVASMLFDISFMTDEPMRGFSPAHVGLETMAARAQLPKSVSLAPIVQTEDARLDETEDAVFKGGADACGEFMYAQKFPEDSHV
jgi:hypothetical protein